MFSAWVILREQKWSNSGERRSQWHMIEAWRTLLYCDEDHEAKNTRDPVAPATRSKEALQKVHTKRLEGGSQGELQINTPYFGCTTLAKSSRPRQGFGGQAGFLLPPSSCLLGHSP